MKRHQSKLTQVVLAFVALCSFAGIWGCSDDYVYDDKDPDFLGASIYDYLTQKGNFTYYVRLVDDLNYKEVLSLTGSKTIFPANDEAFEHFFANNPYGVKSYGQLSISQKKALLNSSMINMAYLAYMLANTSATDNSTGEGLAVRRPTSYTYLDSISFITDSVQLAAPFWKRFADKGLYLVDDETDPYMIHFTPQHTTTNNIQTSDLSLILGTEYSADDIFVNGIKVVQKDICCKNGYVHEMNEVLTPEKNMSQIIASNGATKLFNKLMNRFSAPYFNSSVNSQVHAYYDGSTTERHLISDSVYVKHYFTATNTLDPDGNDMTNYGLLYYDPSNNAYSSMQDMGIMFVPTDDAMSNYINGTKGRYLKDAYGSWENVPNNLLALFVKNHQKKSFMSSLPSTWNVMNDEASFAMNVSKSDVVKSYIGSNGVVFVTNKVYPPIDYQSVYASVMTSENTKIMNWAIQDKTMKFYLYLRSMENMYNLIIPTDDAMAEYRDPLSWAKGGNSREIWTFKYDATKSNPVSVDVYKVNSDGSKGAYAKTIDDLGIIRNRLNDICDCHIVVGEKADDGTMSGYIDDGSRTYSQTKGGSTLTISGSGDNLSVRGGGDIEDGVSAATLVKKSGSELPDRYDSDNGRTYFINKILHDPVKSVYTLLGEHDEYSTFFELLNGNDQVFTYFQNDAEIQSIFTLNKASSSSGLGNVVKSFNNFRYTVFVPTKAALTAAFAADAELHTWDEIANQSDPVLKRQWAIHLLRFLRYHFMDNSVYVDGTVYSGMKYETAARNDNDKFQKLTVSNNGNNISIADSKGNIAHVVKTAGLYNLQGRDFIVNNSDYKKADQIISSSRSVIHLIDKALIPE